MDKDPQGKRDRTLLTLTTLAPERPVVTIDDVEHEFRLMQDFGAIEHQEFTRDSQRYDELWNSEGSLNKAEQKQLEQLLDKLFTRTLVKPAALREQLGDRLSGAIQREVVLAFINAPLLMEAMAQRQTEQAEMDEENRSTTAS